VDEAIATVTVGKIRRQAQLPLPALLSTTFIVRRYVQCRSSVVERLHAIKRLQMAPWRSRHAFACSISIQI